MSDRIENIDVWLTSSAPRATHPCHATPFGMARPEQYSTCGRESILRVTGGCENGHEDTAYVCGKPECLTMITAMQQEGAFCMRCYDMGRRCRITFTSEDVV